MTEECLLRTPFSSTRIKFCQDIFVILVAEDHGWRLASVKINTWQKSLSFLQQIQSQKETLTSTILKPRYPLWML